MELYNASTLKADYQKVVSNTRKKSVMYPAAIFDTSPKYSAESIIHPRSTMKMESSY
jgi:hypothetical protein